MKNSPVYFARKLNTSIDRLVTISDLFVNNPGRDFTRSRKMTLKKTIEFLLQMGGNTLSKELLDYYYETDCLVSPSAFLQQRDKLLSSGLGFILNDFNSSLEKLKKFKGYRLLAVDGTGCNIPKNRRNPHTYSEKNDLNEIYVVALYDICNRIFLDTVINGVRDKNEPRALTDMVDRSEINDPTIVIGDRGLVSYNNIAHIEEKGWKYIFRVKGPNVKRSSLSASNVPLDSTFDVDVSFDLTRSQPLYKGNKQDYRLLVSKSTFDYIEPRSAKTYPIKYRAVSIKSFSGDYIYFITNLTREEFSDLQIEELYKERWSIEVSFRDLKYSLGMINFHSKKINSIEQEIYARLIMYNFSQLIATEVAISKKETKYSYQINIKMSIFICKQNYIKLLFPNPPNIRKLIQKFILPIRNNRHYHRKAKIRSRINLYYRIA